MKHLLVMMVLCGWMKVNAQVFLKSGVGYASSKGLLTEVDMGYKHKVHQATLGYVYIPYDYKSFYNVKYGYWLGNFNFHAGLGLVNRGDCYGNVKAYGTYVVGAEYNTEEILQNANLYFGTDLIEKDLTIKAGIKIFYTK